MRNCYFPERIFIFILKVRDLEELRQQQVVQQNSMKKRNSKDNRKINEKQQILKDKFKRQIRIEICWRIKYKNQREQQKQRNNSSQSSDEVKIIHTTLTDQIKQLKLQYKVKKKVKELIQKNEK
ncbi:unnamed protein product [Paramecium sonneborni]|uniref:Uncharacterized protein n=1 Tax=Paramecium sonneborni TaxID=65129 RepID=A0A8S1RRR0_9CILI|nr:unnamed protein product [Paramecium sonneborni]